MTRIGCRIREGVLRRPDLDPDRANPGEPKWPEPGPPSRILIFRPQCQEHARGLDPVLYYEVQGHPRSDLQSWSRLNQSRRRYMIYRHFQISGTYHGLSLVKFSTWFVSWHTCKLVFIIVDVLVEEACVRAVGFLTRAPNERCHGEANGSSDCVANSFFVHKLKERLQKGLYTLVSPYPALDACLNYAYIHFLCKGFSRVSDKVWDRGCKSPKDTRIRCGEQDVTNHESGWRRTRENESIEKELATKRFYQC